MKRLLAACRILAAVAALALLIPAGLAATTLAPSTSPEAQMAHDHHHHYHHRESADSAGHEHTQHRAVHSAMAHCCDDAPDLVDCAASCAVTTGCQLQMMPGDGLIEIASGTAGAINERPSFHADFSTPPATPPPKARI